MKLADMPEAVTHWSRLRAVRVVGTSGSAEARTQQAGEVQLRLVEYGPGYLADHWCSKGHIIYVVAGALTIEHEGGEPHCMLSAGMSWHVGDHEGPPHRVRSEKGATVFIVD
ncbi:MAG: DHCW motif cupin fold protein [Hyphomicrobiales bacterium]